LPSAHGVAHIEKLEPSPDVSSRRLQTLNFDNTYSRLPNIFYQHLAPKPVSAPKLIKLNRALAEQLGLDPDTVEQLDADILAGNRVPEKSIPIAMVYAGHQFGNWVPRLGDGRAILLGEVMDTLGVRRDLQLKGSGPTLYSRMGDGRASLGPVMREYIVSEGMAGLGIPTTRSLAISMTGDMVARETMEPGAILTRVASSHLRIGTFQYFYGQKDIDSIRLLADYAIERHYPEARKAADPYLELLGSVTSNTAELISSWMLVGFIHGVMNTDNMSIAGETIDYGPCAFMDFFNPAKVFSSIDTGGRYAYNQQPTIGLWNLSRFAETLLAIIGSDRQNAIEQARRILDTYWNSFENHFNKGLCCKIGLPQTPETLELAFELLDCMSEEKSDFTLTFRHLPNLFKNVLDGETLGCNYLPQSEHFKNWSQRWLKIIKKETKTLSKAITLMNSVNPLFIPRNHQIQKAIDFATSLENFEPMEKLISAVNSPFIANSELNSLALPPEPNEEIKQTFCGT
tara:strand:+ start:3714 stop:5255 length:1542 start_codon:yes stop_codon:yes gene_type:complete